MTTTPSPAALNALNRHTGYVDRSISKRLAEHAGDEAIAALTKHSGRIPEEQVDKLDLDGDFNVLMHKFARIKHKQDD
jgi:hypothetical protein